ADPTALLLGAMTEYALAHLVLTVCFTALAIRHLRRVALKPDAPASYREEPVFRPPVRHRRKRLDGDPLSWREAHGEALLGSPRVHTYIVYFELVAGWFMVALLALATSLSPDPNAEVRPFSTGYATVLLLTVGAYAAASVSREHERQTID